MISAIHLACWRDKDHETAVSNPGDSVAGGVPWVTLVLPVKDVSAASRLLTLVGIVVVIAGLYFGRPILIPLALAVVLAFLLTSIVRGGRGSGGHVWGKSQTNGG